MPNVSLQPGATKDRACSRCDIRWTNSVYDESDDFVDGSLAAQNEELFADGFAEHLDVVADSFVVEVESADAVFVFGLHRSSSTS